ncbi:MAG: response regulator [Spirochaetaceae bacterium]|nr:response regulator [Spirochaetaceae bacterium]
MTENNHEEISSSHYAIINALNKAIEIFTSHSEKAFEEVISNGLQPVAEAACLDRIAVYRLFDKKSGRMGQIYVWAYGKTVELDEELVELPNIQPVIRWLDILTKGECVHGNANDMPDDQAAFCALFGVKSILFVPIFTHGEFWGVITLEDHTNYRYFKEDCLDVLRSAALLCANAFIRNEKDREIVEANELNRAILDIIPVGFTVVDHNLRFIDCNDAILNILKTTKDYYLDHFDEFSPEYQGDGTKSGEKLVEVHRRSLNGEKFVFEWVHCSSTGELIPFEVTLMSAKYKGNPIVLAYQYDLHNIKKMEKAVAEAEELMRAVTEASPVPYVMFDENLSAVDCNDVTLQIFGCPDKQYFLLNYWKLFLPESQPDGFNSLEKAMDLRNEAFVGGQTRFEWVHRAINGELIPMENTMTQIIHRGKKFIISFKYDMRSTKKMMESISEHSELLKNQLEQQKLISEISRGFISSGNSEAYIKEAIAKFGRYHKVSRVFIFSIDYTRCCLDTAYHWSADGAVPRLAEFDLFAFVKSRFPERFPDCITLPLLFCEDVAANPTEPYYALLSIDIHAFIVAPLYVEGYLWGILAEEQSSAPRHWTDNEKTFTAMTAGSIAGVIMRDIYNKKLKEALHKATVASRAKSEFLSNMSHEIRTPLNAIVGMTTIGKSALDMERKDYALGRIGEASAHLLGVINDILDMSKIEANKFELTPVEFSFEKMVQRVVNVVYFRMEEKKQKFKVYIDRKIPDIMIGDEQRLAQVLTNLVGNAVKFTPENGSIHIGTFFLGEEEGLCSIKVEVADTGIGISPEQKERLFQPFQQAENNTSRKFGGTGLGLSISKRIVDKMGGTIWVESEIGKGSNFIFTIKLKCGNKKEHALHPGLDNVRILAVGNDQDTLSFFSVIIQELGAFCDTAGSGEEAIGIVERNGIYDIYFIDWKLSGIDGIKLTGILKEKGRDPNNSFVIMFSDVVAWSLIEDDAKKAGVDKFLSKPLFPSAVKDAILSCLAVDDEKEKDVSQDAVPVFEGKCILLAEDMEINREIILTLLEPTQLEIDCAENGAIAVQMFQEDPKRYDVIFMDLQMPEMDGLTATQNIRAMDIPKAKSIPIIAMTANVFQEDIDKCLEVGMNDHIGKPLDYEKILEKLRYYLLG